MLERAPQPSPCTGARPRKTCCATMWPSCSRPSAERQTLRLPWSPRPWWVRCACRTCLPWWGCARPAAFPGMRLLQWIRGPRAALPASPRHLPPAHEAVCGLRGGAHSRRCSSWACVEAPSPAPPCTSCRPLRRLHPTLPWTAYIKTGNPTSGCQLCRSSSPAPCP